MNRSSFAELVLEYEKPVFNVVYRMVGDYDEAQDVTQTVFIKAYRAIDTYDRSHRFFSWLYRIAINEAINHLGRRKRTRAPVDPELVDHGPTPEEEWARNEKCSFVQVALNSLSHQYRGVLVLKYFLDLSYREIGAILEIPEKTVKSRLFTGRHLLKETLTKQGYAP